MNKRTVVLLAVLGFSLASFVASGSPVPGFNRTAAPLTQSGTTVGIRSATTSRSGYMTTAQAIALASLVAAPTPSGVSDPLTVAHWTSTTGEFTATGNGATISGTGSTSGTAWGDTFTRANGALVSTLPEFPYLAGANGGVFSSYTESANDFAVTSNSARAAGTGSSILYGDSGQANGALAVTLSALYSGSGPGLVFRTSSNFSQFVLLEWFGGTFYLEHCTTAPISCAADATAAGSLAAGDTLSVVYSGTSVVGKKNGTTVVSATITQYTANTGAGILNYSDPSAVNHYINFSLSGDSRLASIESETSTTPWYIHLGSSGRGPNMPGVFIGGPAGSGAIEEQRAVVLDSSLVVAKQITSSLATGTAPLAVASTTKVANLNVDKLDDLDSTAFATAANVAALRGYMTLVGFLGVSNGSSDSGKLTVDTNAITPKKCTVELEAVGVGAGTCDYSLYDVTTTTLLCTVSIACNASTTTTGTCTASGTAAANDVLSFRATAPAANTSAAQSTLTCSFTQ